MDKETGKSRGFGYADFSSKADLDKCLSFDGDELDGFNIRCDMANSSSGGANSGGGDRRSGGFGGDRRSGGFGGDRRSGGFNSGGNSSFGSASSFPPGKRLKINNLSWDTTRDSLEASFSNAVDVFLVTDRDTGKSRGFGYIEFDSVGEATKQMKKWTGKNIDGRSIRLEFAGERPQSGGGGGGRGGFQGGRGGGRGGPQKFGRSSFSPNPARKGAIQAYEGSKKKFNNSDSD